MQDIPLFPVTVVGSLPRSKAILKALGKRQKGLIGDKKFDSLVHEATLDALRLQDEELNFAVDLLNGVVKGINDEVKTALHICRGNWSQRADVLLRGANDPLIPYLSRMNVRQFVLEYATKRAGSIDVLADLPPDKEIGLGVVDPRTDDVETVDFMVNLVVAMLLQWFDDFNPLWYIEHE